MLHIVTTAVLATMMMGLHRLFLPMAARRRRVSSHATRWCALFNPLLHWTQLLRLFLVFVSMLSLLWYRNMMLMMFSDSTLAPALRRMLDECASIVNLRDRKYRPLILPQNKGAQLKIEQFRKLNFLALL